MVGPPQFVREKLADKGKALPDDADKGGSGGKFPIENAADLAKAIQAFGRAKPTDKDRVKRHIAARAKALKLEKQLPPGWAGKTS